MDSTQKDFRGLRVRFWRTGGLSLCLAMIVLSCPRPGTADDGIDLSHAMFAPLSADEREILLEYHRHYARLKEYYESCTMAVREEAFTLWRPEDAAKLPLPPERTLPDMPHLVRQYTYMAHKGTHFRLDRRETNLELPPKVSSFTGIVTPTKSYLLEQVDDARYVLRQQQKRSEEDIWQLYNYHFVNAPFSESGLPLERMLFAPPTFNGKYLIDKVVAEEQAGSQVATVTTSITSPDGRATFVIQLLPKSGWALKQLDYTSHQSASDARPAQTNFATTKCEYTIDEEGMPQLFEMVHEGGIVEEEKARVYNRQRFIVESFTPGPADLSVFDAKALVEVPAKKPDAE